MYVYVYYIVMYMYTMHGGAHLADEEEPDERVGGQLDAKVAEDDLPGALRIFYHISYIIV
jgi:hypothetical protein